MKIVLCLDPHANYTTMAVCHDNEPSASRDTILVGAIQQRVDYYWLHGGAHDYERYSMLSQGPAGDVAP